MNSFQRTDYPLTISMDGFDVEIHYAITLITDLAVLMLECKINGSVDISALLGDDAECAIKITATEKEHELMNKALMDFVIEPLEYDLCEMVPEEDMLEMAQVCEEVRKELYE